VDYIVLTGMKPYDGRYELNLGEEFTTREWGWIKRHAGYLPLTLTDEAMTDPELACVLAVIVLHRAGRVERQEVPAVFDKLVDAPFGAAIKIEVGEDEQAEGDAGPPASSSNGSDSFSGGSGRTSLETSPPTPPASGIPGLDISAFPPVTPLGT
jgi:hypothetical protein